MRKEETPESLLFRIKRLTHQQGIRLIAIFASFLIFYLYFLFRNITTFYYDSGWYWSIGDRMIQEEGFNLFGFPETFRGYVFPALILITKSVGNFLFHSEFLGFWIISALFLTMTFCVTIPYLFGVEINTYNALFRLLACLILIICFWGDFLCYPLSDFPAVSFLFGGAALLRHALLINRWKRYLVTIFSGVCFYAAYNTRVAFLYGVLFIIIYSFIISVISKMRSRTEQNRTEQNRTEQNIPCYAICFTGYWDNVGRFSTDAD